MEDHFEDAFGKKDFELFAAFFACWGEEELRPDFGEITILISCHKFRS